MAVHNLDASQQQLQEHTVIDEQTRNVVDEQPRNVVDGELGAGEELPGVDTFIVFEWVDYDGDRKKRVRSKSRKREVKKFSLGKVTKVDVDGDDPNVDSVVLVNVWGHSSGSNQYTGKYLPAWLHGQEEKQSINDPSTEDKEFKAWEKDVLASHIISLDICMQPSGESEGQDSGRDRFEQQRLSFLQAGEALRQENTALRTRQTELLQAHARLAQQVQHLTKASADREALCVAKSVLETKLEDYIISAFNKNTLRLYPEYDQPQSSIRPFELSDDKRETIRIQLDHERDAPPLDQPEERYRSSYQSSTEDDFTRYVEADERDVF
eukprot:g69214.t1